MALADDGRTAMDEAAAPGDSPALRTALALLARGLWPVPIHAPGDQIMRGGKMELAKGKEPIGKGWGAERWTAERLRATLGRYPLRGVGLALGPGRAPGGRWLADIEGDGPEAEASRALLFGGEVVRSLGWWATRGSHLALIVEADRLLPILARLKGFEVRRVGQPGVYKLPEFPDLEIRLGGFKADGAVKQIQSVVPPTPGTDGRPRQWNHEEEIAEAPEAFYGALERIAAEATPAPVLASPPLSTSSKQAAPGRMSPEDRAIRYLEKLADVGLVPVRGQSGHDRQYHAACVLVDGFALPRDRALAVLLDWDRRHSQPPETPRGIEHKIDDAIANNTPPSRKLLDAEQQDYRGRGKPRALGDGNGKALTNGHHQGPPTIGLATCAPDSHRPAEAEADPHRLARLYLRIQCRLRDGSTLRFWNDEWHRWSGRAWKTCPDREILAELTGAIKAEFDRIAVAREKSPRAVTTKAVSNAAQALRDLALLRLCDCPRQPAWIGTGEPGDDLPDPVEIVPAGNALIHLPSFVSGGSCTLPLSPRFFSPNSLGYDFDPDALPPKHWIAFLESVWPDDPDSIAALREWFGYLLTFDTSQQKILMMIGPKRSGRGTIARVLRGIVGPDNITGPTLSSLSTNFGLAPLIGKTVAIIADARLSARADQAVIVERLLSISGEDAQTIDRKHKTGWTGTLLTRFVLISNELPRLGDASGALPSRMILLRLTRSFFGAEDTTLTSRLLTERPAILRWAIDGWIRLKERGHFLQPESGQELLEDLRELSSPVGSFVADRCTLGSDGEVAVQDLFAAWKGYCTEKGRDRPGDEAGFGRNLRAVVPSLRTSQIRRDGGRIRVFRGIDLIVRTPF